MLSQIHCKEKAQVAELISHKLLGSRKSVKHQSCRDGPELKHCSFDQETLVIKIQEKTDLEGAA